MENISELKQHLHAVTQTRQISNAMYLLSTSRIRKSMQNIDYNLTYMRKLRATMKDIVSKTKHNSLSDPFIELTEGGKALFDQLFPAWSLNAFSAIALCWLAENYAVAYAITQRLATQEPSLAMLLQAEKLVQLFESPVFVHVRLQLINAGSPALAPLLQSLYGLLMILPQSDAYHLLQNRLTGITPLHVIMHSCEASE